MCVYSGLSRVQDGWHRNTGLPELCNRRFITATKCGKTACPHCDKLTRDRSEQDEPALGRCYALFKLAQQQVLGEAYPGVGGGLACI